MEWLVEDKPSLPVNPDDIHFIKTPTEFYETIISGIKTAQKRIILASLYLGTGQLEIKLIEELKKALNEKPDLEVYILLDYLRGTRGSPDKSSTAMLQSLSDRANVFFYHTPDLRGMIKTFLPARMNEIIGLQHMKFYAFDDSIIISGANLSDSYFTNRQDRYVFIKDNNSLVNFFYRIFEDVATSSFQLKVDGTLELHNEAGFHPFQDDRHQYCTDISSKIKLTMNKFKEESQNITKTSTIKDTMVYPFLQFGPFDINDEVEMLLRLFSRNQSDLDVTIATGYFNPYDDYLDVILKKSNYSMKFLYAAPDANGFYNGEGLSGYIPSLYVDVSKNFYEQCKINEKKIKMYEYSRNKWTFHGKGIWMDDDKNNISATMLGSSNYGYRSACRDLESQVFLITSNEKLRIKLKDEKKALFEYSTMVDPTTFTKRDHFVPFWVRMFSRVFRNFF